MILSLSPQDGPTLGEIGTPKLLLGVLLPDPDPDPKYVNKLFINLPDR